MSSNVFSISTGMSKGVYLHLFVKYTYVKCTIAWTYAVCDGY